MIFQDDFRQEGFEIFLGHDSLFSEPSERLQEALKIRKRVVMYEMSQPFPLDLLLLLRRMFAPRVISSLFRFLCCLLWLAVFYILDIFGLAKPEALSFRRNGSGLDLKDVPVLPSPTPRGLYVSKGHRPVEELRNILDTKNGSPGTPRRSK
jgi:hypothetical protein